MIKQFVLLITFILSVILYPVIAQTTKEPSNYVNPFIGTTESPIPSKWEGHGQLYPGAVAPFGFMQLTPETRVFPPRGYDYEDTSIYYFSCINHASGYPGGSAGNIYIMPVDYTGDFRYDKYSRKFSHEDEEARPGYYSVYFHDNGTQVETTASERTGMFRFTFKPGVQPLIFIGDAGYVAAMSKRVIHGTRSNTVFEFNETYTDKEEVGGGHIFSFAADDLNGKEILLKMSSSTVDFRSSGRNLEVENAGWNFDSLKYATRNKWNRKLSVIEIEDDCIDNKTTFYTALYNSLLIPWVISDTDGYYRGRDGAVYKTKGDNQYGRFSPWDTFRSLHPLLCIIAPDRQNDMILSMLDVYLQTSRLPKGPMTGNHDIPIIVDSYFKGITGFDKDLAYKAMKDVILTDDYYQDYLRIYDQKGYVPFAYPNSVTKTVEFAYNDWVLAQFSKHVMDHDEDYDYLINRSYNYRNLFNYKEGFILPGKEGEFINEPGNFGYKEGDKWIYSMFVPHNVRDLINLTGGNDAFAGLLDEGFANDHFTFDNEPVLHIPYLYNYAKKPYRTQRQVREIMNTHFTNSPGGIPGNDDLGSLSSWFAFSAMGFFPVSPGKPVYDIGSPLFESVTINLPGSKKFVIRSRNSSLENIYVESLMVNGSPHNKSWIPHSLIAEGGEMVFEMGPRHENNWATGKSSADGSEVTDTPRFYLHDISVSKTAVEPHELFWISFKIGNKGALGTKILSLCVDDSECNSKNILLEENSIIIDSISCRLYQTGPAILNFDDFPGHKVAVNVIDNELRNQFEYKDLTLTPVIKKGSSQEITFSIKNIGGHIDDADINVLLSDELLFEKRIKLEPGETRSVSHHFTDYEEGMNKVQVNDQVEIFKVYSDNKDATVLDISMDKIIRDSLVRDNSGFANHGKIVGNEDIKQHPDGRLRFNENQYVYMESSKSLEHEEGSLTIMAWVFSESKNSGLVSLVTKGDYNVIQASGDRSLHFFARGWARGQSNTPLPDNWHDNWHHIACVNDGNVLEVYINGVLRETVDLREGALLNPPSRWHIGRNEEFPSQRIFHGYIDLVRIFVEPLTPEEINDFREKELPAFDID